MSQSALSAFRQLFLILSVVVALGLISLLSGCASPKAGVPPPPDTLPSAASSSCSEEHNRVLLSAVAPILPGAGLVRLHTLSTPSTAWPEAGHEPFININRDAVRV